MSATPEIRVTPSNDAPVRPERDYVLYWMTSARRTRYNFGLQYALEQAAALRRPLIVLEALRVAYPWASARMHRFVLDGMLDNRARLEGARVAYYPYVEPSPGAGAGLLEALAARAARVVADELPCSFLPRMLRAAAGRLDVRLDRVDSNGLLPLRATEAAFPTAHAFRRHLHRALPDHLRHPPLADPLQHLGLPVAPIPPEILARWPAASDALLADAPGALLALPVDHSVKPTGQRGGAAAGQVALARFVQERLDRYGEDRNEPGRDGASGLSPWLHFGQIAAHEVFDAVANREAWHFARLAPKPSGSRQGWWGMSPAAESFLDELVTWRELGYVFCHHRPDHERYESLPEWAQQVLAAHAADPRPQVYTAAELEAAETHDILWNAAQRQLVREGRIHNYLRMLWGKKVLEWSRTPQEAWDTLVHLNNRYALDGRDPNSYSGISWTFGRFDRPWGPRRPIFGTVRYMSSENTARKLDVESYLERWGA